jgi:rod shape-determining protein MreD
MIFIPMILVLLAAGLVQGLVPAVGLLGMAKAPLFLSAVLYHALFHGRYAMLMAAFFGGLLHDSLGFTPLGCSSFCFCLTGLAVQAARELLFKDSLLTLVGLTALFAALLTLVTWLFLAFGDFGAMPPMGVSGWGVWIKAAGTGLLAVIAAPLVFAMARGLDNLVGTGEYPPV